MLIGDNQETLRKIYVELHNITTRAEVDIHMNMFDKELHIERLRNLQRRIGQLTGVPVIALLASTEDAG